MKKEENNINNTLILEKKRVNKSRNVVNYLYRENNSMINNYIEVFGSVNNLNNCEEKASMDKNNRFSCTPNKKLNFSDLSVSSTNKKNFFEGSLDNPLRTSIIDHEEVKINKTLIKAQMKDDITSFHVHFINIRIKFKKRKLILLQKR